MGQTRCPSDIPKEKLSKQTKHDQAAGPQGRRVVGFSSPKKLPLCSVYPPVLRSRPRQSSSPAPGSSQNQWEWPRTRDGRNEASLGKRQQLSRGNKKKLGWKSGSTCSGQPNMFLFFHGDKPKSDLDSHPSSVRVPRAVAHGRRRSCCPVMQGEGGRSLFFCCFTRSVVL